MKALCILVLMFPVMLFAQDAATQVEPGAAFDLIVGSATSYGILGVVGAVLSVVISLFARFFPGPWGKLSDLWRLAISFLITGSGVGILAFVGGGGLSAAIGAGIVGGLAAIGVNQIGKKVVPKPNPST